MDVPSASISWVSNPCSRAAPSPDVADHGCRRAHDVQRTSLRSRPSPGRIRIALLYRHGALLGLGRRSRTREAPRALCVHPLIRVSRPATGRITGISRGVRRPREPHRGRQRCLMQRVAGRPSRCCGAAGEDLYGRSCSRCRTCRRCTRPIRTIAGAPAATYGRPLSPGRKQASARGRSARS